MQAGCAAPVLDLFGLLLQTSVLHWLICVSQHHLAAPLQLLWGSLLVSFVIGGPPTCLRVAGSAARNRLLNGAYEFAWHEFGQSLNVQFFLCKSFHGALPTRARLAALLKTQCWLGPMLWTYAQRGYAISDEV